VADWFAPKRYGYGSGVPIAWQGWVVTLVYAAIVVGATQLLKNNGSAIVTATAIFLVIVIKNTRGGWRWRWGDTE
jgi:hypothetical protein